MSQPKSKIVLFVAVTLQTLLVAAMLTLAIPRYLWGPPPGDDIAMKAYADHAENALRLIVGVWASVVCVTYYLCFIRPHSATRGRKWLKKPPAQKRE